MAGTICRNCILYIIIISNSYSYINIVSRFPPFPLRTWPFTQQEHARKRGGDAVLFNSHEIFLAVRYTCVYGMPGVSAPHSNRWKTLIRRLWNETGGSAQLWISEKNRQICCFDQELSDNTRQQQQWALHHTTPGLREEGKRRQAMWLLTRIYASCWIQPTVHRQDREPRKEGSGEEVFRFGYDPLLTLPVVPPLSTRPTSHAWGCGNEGQIARQRWLSLTA